MGTYFYSGLHPREGTIPVHTFFHGLGGKPVVAMKSSIVIEGQSLQKVHLKEVEAIMNAYEQFHIPTIYKTDQEYDYALLVENLDNDSVPEKVEKGSSKPGESVMGVVIDHNRLDGTYTVGCGPLVFTNVTSDVFIRISPESEFPCVQIQRGFDSCPSGNICVSESSIKKLLDPLATITSQESAASPQHSARHGSGRVTPPVAGAMAQGPPASTRAASQGTKLQSPTSSSGPQSLRSSLQQTQKNAAKGTAFKPFTGWSSSLRNEHLEYQGDSSSDESPEEDPWALPDPIDPFRNPARTPITEYLREQPRRSKSSSPFPTSPQVPVGSTNNSSDTLYRLSPTSLTFKPVYPPAQMMPMNSSNLTPSTSSLSYVSLNPQAERSQLNPFINVSSPLRSESTQSQAQSNQLNPFNSSGSSKNEISKPVAHRRHPGLSESTSSCTSYESLLPQAPRDPTLQAASSSSVPAAECESHIQACSEMSLEDFEVLRPTLSSLEKNSKIIENYMTVTI